MRVMKIDKAQSLASDRFSREMVPKSGESIWVNGALSNHM
jgi:hypothetical protein